MHYPHAPKSFGGSIHLGKMIKRWNADLCRLFDVSCPKSSTHQPSATSPHLFSTISMLDKSPKVSTTNPAMWETTFPRNSHAGLGRDFTNMFHTREYVSLVKWPTQSGVAISRKCCFPHGNPVVSDGCVTHALEKCFANQPSATHRRFDTNLPFHDFPKTVNHESWLK